MLAASFCWSVLLAPASADAAESRSAAASKPQSRAASRQPAAADFDPTPQIPAARARMISGATGLPVRWRFVRFGPRYLGSAGHAKAEQFISRHLEGDRSSRINSPRRPPRAVPDEQHHRKVSRQERRHHRHRRPLRHELSPAQHQLCRRQRRRLQRRTDAGNRQPAARQSPEGYSIWLLFTDGEEATWNGPTPTASTAASNWRKRWDDDGTRSKIKAFLLLDMIGDKELDIDRDTNSTPWLLDVVYAAQPGWASVAFFARQLAIEDDHLPLPRGVPVADIIDLDYGFNNLYHHTPRTPSTNSAPPACKSSATW